MIVALYLLGQHWREFALPLCAGVFLLALGLWTVGAHVRLSKRRRP